MYFSVSIVNLEENIRNLEIPCISYTCCLQDCRNIDLLDYQSDPIKNILNTTTHQEHGTWQTGVRESEQIFQTT